MMGRREERLFRINDEIAALRRDEYRAREELISTTTRDAAVSGQIVDAADARETAADVARMEQHVGDIQAALGRLERKRDRMMAKLGS